jgi:hypothetical protein
MVEDFTLRSTSPCPGVGNSTSLKTTVLFPGKNAPFDVNVIDIG